ncbi:MAG: hypothetical protein NVS9B1_18940 [Candidatus Dormibacteraceae bacterium]
MSRPPNAAGAAAPQGGTRRLGPMLVGGVVGLTCFALLLAAGLLLYQRLYGDSTLALLVILAVFGGFGAYLAWLVGVLAFSRMRGQDEEGDGKAEGGGGSTG